MEPRHLALPIRVGSDGALATVAQGSQAEIEQNVHTAARTLRGSRPGRPTFGISDPTFTDVDPDELEEQLAEHEPDALVTVDADPFTGDLAAWLTVTVDTDPTADDA